MTDPYPFLNDAPEGFEPSNVLAWIAAGASREPTPAVLSYRYEVFDSSYHHHFNPPVYVLCQKWTDAIPKLSRKPEIEREPVWVRVPVETP